MKASDLKVGDRIRLHSVPEADLKDRASRTTDPDFPPTATVLEHLIAMQPVVTITHIDEYGHPWFDAEFNLAGDTECHSLAIMDDDSWDIVAQLGKDANRHMRWGDETGTPKPGMEQHTPSLHFRATEKKEDLP